MMSGIRLENITKQFEGSTAVNKLSLEIADGEFLVLVGPSGCGKSTLLRLLAGLEEVSDGRIMLDGNDISGLSPRERNFSMIFQNYALFPHMTVAQNVAYPLRVRNISGSERIDKVKKALDMVQMGKFGDRYPAQLSGGQQQRIALARALVFDPKLVLMDEPLGALDKQLREHMQLELKALHKRLGVTFVYVTHDQSEALTMSDRVAVFDQGIIQQLAVVDRLYEYPENQFVAGFIGDNNRFNGVLAAGEGANGTVRLPHGGLLSGLNANDASVGRQVVACIRPERIKLLPLADAPEQALRVSVSSLIYFGDHVRVRCAIPQQDDCFVKLSLNDPALAGLYEGTEVALDVDPKHLRIFI